MVEKYAQSLVVTRFHVRFLLNEICELCDGISDFAEAVISC
jgi:hypothetical protein